MATGGYAALMAVGALMPIPPTETRGLPLDKLVHLCEYWLFAWLLVQAGRACGFARVKVLAVAFLLSFSYGLVLEGVQLLLPYRRGQWEDMAANALGSLMGTMMGWSRNGTTLARPGH